MKDTNSTRSNGKPSKCFTVLVLFLYVWSKTMSLRSCAVVQTVVGVLIVSL
jgi:hypothetical protein